MRNSLFFSIGLLLLLIISGCGENKRQVIEQDKAFASYITGYTSNVISSRGEVVVRLSSEFEESSRPQSNLFQFKPSVEGEQVWLDGRTVAFRPDEGFKNGTRYIASFRTGSLFDVSENLQTFQFDFEILQQNLEVSVGDATAAATGDRSRQQLEGTVYTADVAELKAVKKVLEAEQGSRELPVEWQQESDEKAHHFIVKDIERTNSPESVYLSWDGSPIGATVRGQRNIEIPPLDAFELVRAEVVRDVNPHVEVAFSDELDTEQDLQGLIRIDSYDDLDIIVQQNRVELYPRKKIKGKRTLHLSPGIRSRHGKRLGKKVSRTIRLHQPKPQVRFVGKGEIIPSSEELLVPFEAVSLGAVDVQVTRIFENNVSQFLQFNSLGGRRNLKEVGRPIVQKVIPLSALGNADVSSWNGYALDLSDLIEPEPGAIYQVVIGFRKHQAVYPCGDGALADIEDRKWTLSTEEENEYWESFQDSYYPDGYNWRERKNPCDVSYYRRSRFGKRNVLASDLGLIAKQGKLGTTQFVVTDLKTAQPKSGVNLAVYDYQQQKLASLTSNGQGMAKATFDRKPFLVVAKDGPQRGYLRMKDGSALSLSEFDVSGARVKEGVKGFLYGERGVWRPGDSLFVTLMVEDKQDVLPANHPVTFELRDPSGQLRDQQTINNPVNGFYSYQHRTGKDDPTGNWRLSAQLGGNTFSKTLKIETVKPNRLKVNLGFNNERLTASDRTLDGQISAQWLHGATARNLKTDMSMTLLEASKSFEGYEDYIFDDPSRSLSAATEEIFTGELDESGQTDFSYTLNKMDKVPGALRLSLLTRVYEESGNFSVNRSSIPYYPYETMVGLRMPETKSNRNMLDRDKTHTLDLVSLDIDGEPAPRQKVKVEIFKIDWRWWWEKSNENLSQYFGRRDVESVFSTETRTDGDGKTQVDFNIDEYRWGRFMVRVTDVVSGSSTGETFYLGWSYFRNNQVGNPSRLSFESDKEKYEVGEEVTLTIPSSADGKALVSLESGSKVLQKFWVDTQKEQTKASFLASKDMAPNIYAHVLMMQPHGQKQNDRPIRMYGVIPISVENPATQLNPTVELPSELRPESTVDIEVSEENGRAMTYTVAMVDEGLLDLTNFSTPAPHNSFYAREALGVKTWDLFDHVASAYAGSMNRILSIGGDQDAEGGQESTEVNRFEPMVRFVGPFELKEGTTNRHSIDVPNYVGSVRTMVVAGQDGAYGHAEKDTPVRKPVMVQGTLPRVLGPGEKVTLPVSVFAMNDDIEQVEVQVEANELFDIEDVSAHTVSFEEPGEKTIRFKLKVKSSIGAGKVQIDALSGSETAHHDIDIKVRNPNPPVTDLYNKVLEAGEEWSFDYTPVGLAGTNTGVFEVSTIPPIDLGRRLKYLIQYPHGCIEQVTSSVFPQLYLPIIMDISEGRKQKIQKHVDAAIERLKSFQTSSGGLGYWPGHNHANEWGTNYAYHFLLEAQSRGYYVPSELLSNINSFQRRKSSGWQLKKKGGHNKGLTQAYRLYTLALANTPDLGAMNRLREQYDLSPKVAWRLAAAYELAGQAEAADELVNGVSTEISKYREMSRTYGSATRDKAMILETLSIMEEREKAAPIMRDIAKELNRKRWMSTQTTAYSLIAIARFLNVSDTAKEIDLQYNITGAGKGAVTSTAPISQVPFTIDGQQQQQVTVKNNSKGVVFARLIQEGTPLVGDTTSTSNNLVQKVRYRTLDGDKVDPTQLPQGTDIVAEVTVSNPTSHKRYSELALTQIFPSGWEIRNVRMDDIKFKEPTAVPEYQDIRDDRVYTYFDLGPRKSKTFRTVLNVSYTGTFYLPTISTSAMYDEAVNARTAGQWVEVVLPK
ncbi:hypothetical protein G3569_01940 [Aliifodinibius halophilus]|uniref:Alpha-2-macroglobulin n=2 Tax=Fodinibius halophilus TaxID=1736908 RepID=A0A6M1T575_9BACT|nr:hypothetical protein [Fodinibius halophilus]